MLNGTANGGGREGVYLAVRVQRPSRWTVRDKSWPKMARQANGVSDAAKVRIAVLLLWPRFG